MKKDKLWTKEFVFITGISLFAFIAFYILLAVLPLYLVGVLHAGNDTVGLLVTLFLIPAILIRPFVGKWIGKGAQKKKLILSTVAFFIPLLLYPFATNIIAMLILRVLHGIAFGVITTVKGTVCTGVVPVSRRGEGLGYFTLAMSLAMVIGPYIGLSLANKNAYTIAFIVCILFSAVSILFAVFIKIPNETKPVNSEKKPGRFSWDDFFDIRAMPYASAMFILASAYAGISTFLVLYTKSLGLTIAASYFYILFALMTTIFRPLTGRLSDKQGSKAILYPCMLLFAGGLFALNQAHTGVAIMVTGVLVGIGYGSAMSLLQTEIVNSVEHHRAGVAYSLFFSSMDMGMAVGSYILGVISGFYGYSSIYLVGIGFIVVAALEVFVFGYKKKKRSN